MVMRNLPTENTDERKARLRLWISLLRSSRTVEADIRNRLRKRFDLTLPRFDVLAALARKPEGMMMSQLSRYLVVSNGNVTGIVDRLVKDGLVARFQREGDRRSWIISLTETGNEAFKEMAEINEHWINEIFSSFDAQEAEIVQTALNKLHTKRSHPND